MRLIFISQLAIAMATILSCGTVDADQLTLKIGEKTHELTGEILLEGQDESLLFQENNGRIWFVKPEEVRSKERSSEPAKPISKKAFGQQLLAELPPGFRILKTKRYVIAYQNEATFARWIAGLYESRLYHAFSKFGKRNKLTLVTPQHPLAIIIFGSRSQYQRHVDQELGAGQDITAYYNVLTNRVTMFDLTAAPNVTDQVVTDRNINEILQTPAAIAMVATAIHEATHQLIFNRGLQTRFAESPLWLNEGLAMYFEAPNVKSKRGWLGPGKIFSDRLIRFRNYLPHRPANSLVTLIGSDERLQKPDTALDGYAEAWALNHFLLKRKSKTFAAYLRHMSTKKPLVEDSTETRVTEFKEFFGDDLAKLDKEFIAYVRKLRL